MSWMLRPVSSSSGVPSRSLRGGVRERDVALLVEPEDPLGGGVEDRLLLGHVEPLEHHAARDVGGDDQPGDDLALALDRAPAADVPDGLVVGTGRFDLVGHRLAGREHLVQGGAHARLGLGTEVVVEQRRADQGLAGGLAVRVEDAAVAVDDDRDVGHAAQQQLCRLEAGTKQLLDSMPVTDRHPMRHPRS